jgi:hypothetical protein
MKWYGMLGLFAVIALLVVGSASAETTYFDAPEFLWSASADSTITTEAISADGGVLYVADNTVLKAYDDEGSLLWSEDVGVSIQGISAGDGHVYVGYFDGDSLLTKVSESGSIVYSVSTSDTLVRLYYHDGFVYGSGGEGVVAQISAATGSLVDTGSIPAGISAMGSGGDGRLLVIHGGNAYSVFDTSDMSLVRTESLGQTSMTVLASNGEIAFVGSYSSTVVVPIFLSNDPIGVGELPGTADGRTPGLAIDGEYYFYAAGTQGFSGDSFLIRGVMIGNVTNPTDLDSFNWSVGINPYFSTANMRRMDVDRGILYVATSEQVRAYRYANVTLPPVVVPSRGGGGSLSGFVTGLVDREAPGLPEEADDRAREATEGVWDRVVFHARGFWTWIITLGGVL